MSEKEPEGQTMPTSAATSKESERTEERRNTPRETLKRYVVLVFFGEDNWGKLTNMSESGMAFEFAKPPSLEDRVNFTFQAMGCMPMPRNGKALGDSFEAPGKIVWTREFERGAGVEFVDLAEASREQIRQWVSFETSTNASAHAEQTKPAPQPILAELLAPLEPGANSKSPSAEKEPVVEVDMLVPIAETITERDSAFLEPSAAEQSLGAPNWGAQEEKVTRPHPPEFPTYSHPSVARLTFLVVSGCLVAFAVTAGVRIFMAREAHRADTEVRASDAPAPVIGESTGEVNVASPVPTPVSSFPVASSPATSSSVAGAPPFQVDVLDADGRNWILWFVHGGAKDKGNPPPYRPVASSDSSAPAMKTTKREPEKPQEVHSFTLAAPNVSHPANANAGKPSADAPAIQPETSPSLGGPIGCVLTSKVAPAPPAAQGPVGGMVQQPRLLRSAPLVYPQLAKLSRVSGDVVVDALIDTAGKVTTVKVISGPVLLQQAATDTVHQWKYEPARLDGQAVSMHLTVTVRFRLN